MEKSGRKKLALKMLGMDARSEHTLRLFLTQNFADRYCFEVESEDASLYIINMDGADSEKHYAWAKAHRAAVPRILTSFRQQAISPEEYFIRKPLIVGEFGSVFEQISSECVSTIGAKKSGVKTASPPQKKTDKEIKSLASKQENAVLDVQKKKTHKVAELMANTQTQSAVERRTGMIAHQRGSKANATDSLGVSFFEPKNYASGAIQKAVAQARSSKQVVRLTSQWLIMTIFPITNRVYLELGARRLQSLCVVALNKQGKGKGFAIDTLDIEDSENAPPDWRCQNLEYYRDLDAFLWQIAIWTSRGQAITNTSMNEVLYIKAWPNLSRFICPAKTLPILAAWLAKPQSINNLAIELDLPIDNILTLHTALVSLDLVGEGLHESDRMIETPVVRPGNFLLSRLLKKLVGEVD